ncbi:hypothetical protein M8C21_013463, partial [Ambrosia artemisiifolia]
MVFSSVPPYLDHHNWHHQLTQLNHQGVGGVAASQGQNPNLQSPVPPPPTGGGRTGDGEGSIRPRSMVELARHFCKACRRYWTRGGVLKNVPAGGGCRRNKRSSKSRNSKSPSQSGPKSLSVSPPRTSSDNMTSTQIPHPPSLHLPFMSSLSQYGSHVGGNLSSTIAGFHLPSEIRNFQIGNGSNFNNILSIGGGENWRLPFLPGFEVPNNANPFNFHTEGVEAQSSLMVGGETSLNNNSGIENPRMDPDPPIPNYGLEIHAWTEFPFEELQENL